MKVGTPLIRLKSNHLRHKIYQELLQKPIRLLVPHCTSRDREQLTQADSYPEANKAGADHFHLDFWHLTA